MSTSTTPFAFPEQQEAKDWYTWIFKRQHQKDPNPFHPTNVDQFWGKNKDGVEIWKNEMANESLIWLAGLIATTVPAKKPSQIPNLNAIVSGSDAKAVYADGNGGFENDPPATSRNITITIDENDSRDFYIPVATELATATKYPKQADRLGELAEKIIDREEEHNKGVPPGFVEFENVDANGQMQQYQLSGNELKNGFRINANFELNILSNNFFLLPEGNGPAAFSDYAVKLKHDALEGGQNKLRFGVTGKFFGYDVEYTIVKPS
jgi:hypothetical protein